MYGKKMVHDLSTGLITYVDLTAEEIAQRDAERLASELDEQTQSPPPPSIEELLAMIQTLQSENLTLQARIDVQDSAIVDLLIGGV